MHDDLFSTLSHWSTGLHTRQTDDPKHDDGSWSQPENGLVSWGHTHAHDADAGALYPTQHTGHYSWQTPDGQTLMADSHAQDPWTSEMLDYQVQQYQTPVDTHDFTETSHQTSEHSHFFTENHHQMSEEAHFFAEEAHNVHDLHKESHMEHDDLMGTGSSGHHRGTETLLGQPYPTLFNPHPELPMVDHEGHNQHINQGDPHLRFAPGESLHYDHTLTPYVDPHPWAPGDFHGIGHPDVYSHDWQQQTGEDCAIIAQGDILASITGHMLSEHQLCEEAITHHLYDPRTGTHPKDLGKLLELHGIPVERSEHSTFEDLAQALQNNQRVVVGVNANEIWFPHRDVTTGEPAQLPYAGHAVWVTGINTSQTGTKVILSDSGPANGGAEAVDIHDFLNAWHDANNLMVTTTHSYPPISA